MGREIARTFRRDKNSDHGVRQGWSEIHEFGGDCRRTPGRRAEGTWTSETRGRSGTSERGDTNSERLEEWQTWSQAYAGFFTGRAEGGRRDTKGGRVRQAVVMSIRVGSGVPWTAGTPSGSSPRDFEYQPSPVARARGPVTNRFDREKCGDKVRTIWTGTGVDQMT